MRDFLKTDFIGKTIKSVDNTSVNVLKFIFTDETTLELWAEDRIHTNFGNIPGFFVEEPRQSNG